MSQHPQKTPWGPILILGSIWGLSEAALGMYLRQCASNISGSLMTGTALFFLAAAWAVSPRIQAIAGMVALASFFKLFDALLLGLPVLHGSVANPIFAMAAEGAAFLLFITIIRGDLTAKWIGRGLVGGLSAGLAAGAFPLVRFATGIAACVVAGSTIPLSLYYAPVAILLSMLAVPAGYGAGAKTGAFENRFTPAGSPALRWASPAVLVLCLAVLAVLRLV